MKSSFHTEVETPKKDLPRISGSEAVIRSFLAEGVETIFGYPVERSSLYIMRCMTTAIR